MALVGQDWRGVYRELEVMGEVSFPGEPPFHLPTAQGASATAFREIVEVTLRVIAPGHGPEPQAVRTAMTWKVARQLLDSAARLTASAIDVGTPKFNATSQPCGSSHPF
jgi:hypothetical protein